MCVSTKSHRRFCASFGGLKPEIYIVSINDVTTIPAPNTNHTIATAITLAAGKSWGVWQGDQKSFKLEINSVGENGSKAFRHTLELHRSGFDEQFEKELSDNINGNFLILVPDKSGRMRLLGTIDDGAYFTSDGVVSTTGMSIEEKNGNTLKFEWDAPHKAYFYTSTVAKLPFA